jgi:hypothetical protein
MTATPPTPAQAAWVGKCASCTHYAETAGAGIGTGRCMLRSTGTAESDSCDWHTTEAAADA